MPRASLSDDEDDGGNERGTGTAPALNDYKVDFLKRRWTQTVLGGVELRLRGTVPAGVYALQFAVWLLPVLLAVPFTVYVEVAGGGAFTTQWVAQVIYGAVMAVSVLVLQLVSMRMRAKVAAASAEMVGGGADTDGGGGPTFNEEDEHEFDSSCAPGVWALLVPRVPAAAVLARLALSALLCGYALGYLLPSRINSLYGGSMAALVLMLIFGWLCVTLAHFSLAARSPPEPNHYASNDPLGLANYQRPLTLLLFFIIDLVSFWSASVANANLAIRVLFLFLPLLWAFGLLPPPDAFFFWALEQIQVWALGGTPTVSNVRTLALFAVSAIAWAAVLLVSQFVLPLAGQAVAAALGYLLSRNILPLPAAHRSGERPTLVGLVAVSGAVRLVIDLGFAAACAGVTVACGLLGGTASAGAGFAIGCSAVLSAAFVILVAFEQLQRPFCFKLIRNPLHVKGGSRRLSALYRAWSGFVPWLSVVYCSFYLSRAGLPWTVDALLEALLVSRLYRWAWQSPPRALLEVTVVGWLRAFGGWTGAGGWLASDLGLQLLLVAVAHDRLRDLFDKLYFVALHTSSTFLDRKLRFGHFLAVHVVQLCCAPFVLALVLLSVALGSPLVPFLGLPLYLPGYPRPFRQWPVAGENYSPSEDTVYYRQLVPRLSRLLPELLESGRLGAAACGALYLARLESRIVWLEVVERGYAYAVVVAKGLEMQETSCHHVEAGILDDTFSHAGYVRGGDVPAETRLNRYWTHVVQPRCTLPVATYSNSEMRLTGLIDSPDTLRVVTRTFYKTLLWVLFRATSSELGREFPERWRSLRNLSTTYNVSQPFPVEWYSFLTGPGRDARDPLVRLVNLTYAIVEAYGLGGLDPVRAGPKHVCDVFQGNIPVSHEAELLSQDADLKRLTVTAYRYAWKLALDEVTVGEYDTPDALKEALLELETSWYLGPEADGDNNWQQQMLAEKPNLLSLSKNDDVYTCHILSIGQQDLYVASLSEAVVKGLWASLNTDLLYVTNDDDERYGIQAHAKLLRNISTQSAEPPLGYPCYATNISLP